MAVKVVVLYTVPQDPDAWDAHYLSEHTALVEQIPGLDHWDGGHVLASADGGEPTYWRIAELWFPDRKTMQAGLGSEAGKQTYADYVKIAPTGSQMFIAAVD